MNAIERMREEHGTIKEMLQILGIFCARLESGESADLADAEAMIGFFQVYADRFHHDKEERLLFPLLEKLGVPRAGGPVEIMLEDHALGRGYLLGMLEVLQDLPSGGEAVRSFALGARNFIHLMTEHIKTEDDAIFDLAEMRLSSGELAQLAAEFVTVEQVILGSGRKEALQSLLARLGEKYL